eukprot:765181-Hanusia_phi.AAC.3
MRGASRRRLREELKASRQGKLRFFLDSFSLSFLFFFFSVLSFSLLSFRLLYHEVTTRKAGRSLTFFRLLDSLASSCSRRSRERTSTRCFRASQRRRQPRMNGQQKRVRKGQEKGERECRRQRNGKRGGG